MENGPRTGDSLWRPGGEAKGERTGARCSLCGGPNECARALGNPRAPDSGERCWCFERRFPTSLLVRASERDGGAACICQRCLDKSDHPGAD
jgi:hypothetical protein